MEYISKLHEKLVIGPEKEEMENSVMPTSHWVTMGRTPTIMIEIWILLDKLMMGLGRGEIMEILQRFPGNCPKASKCDEKINCNRNS